MATEARPFSHWSCPLGNGKHCRMNEIQNHRILIVDDNRAIHGDFKKVFNAESPAAIDSAAAAIFGEPAVVTTPTYDLEFACQGQEAVEKVGQSLETGRRLSMA